MYKPQKVDTSKPRQEIVKDVLHLFKKYSTFLEIQSKEDLIIIMQSLRGVARSQNNDQTDFAQRRIKRIEKKEKSQKILDEPFSGNFKPGQDKGLFSSIFSLFFSSSDAKENHTNVLQSAAKKIQKKNQSQLPTDPPSSYQQQPLLEQSSGEVRKQNKKQEQIERKNKIKYS